MEEMGKIEHVSRKGGLPKKDDDAHTLTMTLLTKAMTCANYVTKYMYDS